MLFSLFDYRNGTVAYHGLLVYNFNFIHDVFFMWQLREYLGVVLDSKKCVDRLSHRPTKRRLMDQIQMSESYNTLI